MSINNTNQNTNDSLPKHPQDLSIISEEYLLSNTILEIDDSNEDTFQISKEEQDKVSQHIEITVELSKKIGEIRKENQSSYKKYDFIDFKQLGFDQVNKISKKLSKINKETFDSLLEEIESTNFSKIIEELPVVILDSKFDCKDVPYIVKILSELNQTYENFGSCLKTQILKESKSLNADQTGKTSKDDEEEKRLYRKKAFYRLCIEAYLYGLIDDFNIVRDLFKRLIPTNKDEIPTAFPLLTYILKIFSELLFGVRPKHKDYLIKKGLINEYSIYLSKEKETLEKYISTLQDYYYKVILPYIEEKNKQLVDLEKKNLENLSKLESSTELQEKYSKQRQFYYKILSYIKEYCTLMNCRLPQLANDKFLRLEDSRKQAAMRIEKVNKFDPFSDEFEMNFYTILPLLNENEGESVKKPKDEELIKSKFDLFSTQILKCDSKDQCDELVSEFFLCLNTAKYRKQALKLFLRGSSKTNFSLLKYYSRFIKSMSYVNKDIKDDISEALLTDFNNGFTSNKLNNIDERIKNIKFISELIKFEVFPTANIVTSIINRLFEDFTPVSIELLCILIDSCGRFLYLHEVTHLKFNTFLNEFKSVSSRKIYYDTRLFNSVLNSIQSAKLNESMLKRKVKIRTVEEEYIKYVLLSELNKTNVKEVSILIRRLNWDCASDSNNRFLVFKYIYKLLTFGKESDSDLACVLLIHLKDSHTDLINNIFLSLLEELRIGLERQDFEDNQHKMNICSILGKWYVYKLITSDHIFFILYFILIYSHEWAMGNTEFKVDNLYDSNTDFTRILMTINIIEVIGDSLKKERLNEFVCFLELYILSKKFLPTDVENRVLNVLEGIMGKSLKVFNDFSLALKESNKFFGFGEEKDCKESSIFQSVTENDDKKVYILDEKDEFDRKETIKVRVDLGKEALKDKERIDFNFEDEFKKMINDSIKVAGCNSKASSNIINLEDDMKKMKNIVTEGSSVNGVKLKLISKKK